MARIAPAATAASDYTVGMDIDPMTANGANAMMSTMAHCPELAEPISALTEALLQSSLGIRLTELVRLRIAFHNQCRTCMSMRYAPADAVDENLVCSLERPEESADLTEAERAAIGFADLFATDHLAIDDAVYDNLRKYFDEGQLVELGVNCAINLGLGRLSATWNLVEHLPADFREPAADVLVTPWGHSLTDSQP
jgi:alkylhydroperoxidase family enzyme